MEVMRAVLDVCWLTIEVIASAAVALLHRPASTARRFQLATTTIRLTMVIAAFVAMSIADTEETGVWWSVGSDCGRSRRLGASG